MTGETMAERKAASGVRVELMRKVTAAVLMVAMPTVAKLNSNRSKGRPIVSRWVQASADLCCTKGERPQGPFNGLKGQSRI